MIVVVGIEDPETYEGGKQALTTSFGCFMCWEKWESKVDGKGVMA